MPLSSSIIVTRARSYAIPSRSPSYCTSRQISTRQLSPRFKAGLLPQSTALHRTSLVEPQHELRAMFRATSARQHSFFGAMLASVLKASSTIVCARWITKIALTFVPIIVIKNAFARKYLKHIIKQKPELAHKREYMERKLRKYTRTNRILIATPIVLFVLTFFASLERTPLSGRWRVILLSPEEEDGILKQLQRDGWYRAVLQVISQDGPPNIIPPTDWRYQVVEATLRHLESTIPMLASEKHVLPWLDRGPDDILLPPPAKYPLKPRPSAKEYLRWFCDNIPCERRKTARTREDVDSPHLIPGPPYNLIVVDRPDCDNAFSFGFGPDGGGGIVVYSGFLHRVFGMSGNTVVQQAPTTAEAATPSRSLVTELVGSLLAFSSPSPSPERRWSQMQTVSAPEPTEEQITELAILLAHELAHLILSHHLESLSSSTVFIPGTVSIFSDLLRALVFPITMMFGPFVNDALANWGKAGASEFEKLSETCTSMALEFEADAVSARILAHAGFDARATLNFWKRRRDAECSPSAASRATRYADDDPTLIAPDDINIASIGVRLAKKLMSVTHPAHEARLLRLKSELQRWETERARALRKRAKKLKMMALCQKDYDEHDERK